MDYTSILKRAFEITWRYKVLWVFGFLAALFGGNDGGFGGGFGGGSGRAGGRVQYTIPAVDVSPWLIVGIVALVLLFVLIAVVLSIVSNAALMASVREIEGGRPIGVGKGFGLGFRRFWPYLGISLVIGIPMVVTFIGLLMIGLAPLLLLFTRQAPLQVMGVIVAVVLLIPIVLLLIAASVVLAVLMEFFLRACAVEDLGVGASLRRGWDLARRHPGKVAVLWAVLFGAGIIWGIIMFPVTLGLLGILAAAAFGTYAVFAAWQPAVVTAIVVGLPVVLVLVFLGGLYKTFTSSYWTLGYLKLAALSDQQAG